MHTWLQYKNALMHSISLYSLQFQFLIASLSLRLHNFYSISYEKWFYIIFIAICFDKLSENVLWHTLFSPHFFNRLQFHICVFVIDLNWFLRFFHAATIKIDVSKAAYISCAHVYSHAIGTSCQHHINCNVWVPLILNCQFKKGAYTAY